MKNNYYEDPFLKIIPKIDLHGETVDTALWLAKDFINVSIKMERGKIGIIHGRHSTLIRTALHNYLKTDKRIKNYYTYYSNDGITIIEFLKHK